MRSRLPSEDTAQVNPVCVDNVRLAYGTESDRTPKRFGEYLVEIGALSPVQLRAALAYQRTKDGIKLGRAASALGFASEPKIEWAAHSFHGKYR